MTRRILIVDDLATNRILLKAKLSQGHHEILLASSGREAREIARQRPVDLVLFDHDMPGMSGIDLCRALRGDPQTARTILVMITSLPDRELRLQALRAGADDVLSRGVTPQFLQARLRSLLRTADRELALRDEAFELDCLSLAEPATGFTHLPSIALVAPDLTLALRWRNQLAPHLEARFLPLPQDTVLAEGQPRADLYLIADDLGPCEAGRVMMSEILAYPGKSRAAVCLLMPPGAPGPLAAALDLGADEVAPEAFDAMELALRLRRLIALKRRRDELQNRLSAGLRLALIDPLTGLSNRRQALPALSLALARPPDSPPCAAMLLDIDHFKQVNDRYGHAAGDAVLVELAQRLRSYTPAKCILARLGGDEFLIVEPTTGEPQAQALAEALRQRIAAEPIMLPGQANALQVTASIGVAVARPGCETVEDLLARADRALLAAKALGRDRIALRSHTAA